MSELFSWVAATAIGLALGAVFICAKAALVNQQSLDQKRAEPKPMLPPHSPQWRIISEGVLALDGTQYEIRYQDGGFVVYWNGNRKYGWTDLGLAKRSVMIDMADLIEVGIEP